MGVGLPGDVQIDEQKKAAFWKDQLEAVGRSRDKWRQCPMTGCPNRPYKYESRESLERHLRSMHGAK